MSVKDGAVNCNDGPTRARIVQKLRLVSWRIDATTLMSWHRGFELAVGAREFEGVHDGSTSVFLAVAATLASWQYDKSWKSSIH